MKIRLLGLRDWLWLVVLILIFPPACIQIYSSMYSASMIIKCVFALCIFVVLFLKKQINTYVAWILLFYGLQIASTFLRNPDYGVISVREALCSLAIVLGFYWMIYNEKGRIQKNLVVLLQTYIVINFVFIFISPNLFGEYSSWRGTQSNYFLGIKNQMALVLIPMVSYIMIENYKKNKRKDIWTFILLVISLVTEIVIDSSTGVVAMLVMVGLYIVYGKYWDKLFDLKGVIIVILIANIALIFFQSILAVPAIQSLIENIFHKDFTLSNRTEIWARALLRFQDSPFLGLGRQENKNMITFTAISQYDTDTNYSAHNVLLQTLLESGFLGLIPLVGAFVVLLRKAKNISRDLMAIVCVALMAILVSFLAEAYDLTYFFAIACCVVCGAHFDTGENSIRKSSQCQNRHHRQHQIF